MLTAGSVQAPPLWSAAEVEAGLVAPAEHAEHARAILRWARDFLVPTHPELGRPGPVCPYTSPSLRKNLFHVAVPDAADVERIAAAVGQFRRRFQDMAAGLDEADGQYLTFVLLFPDFDHTDSAGLDDLQRAAKQEFVAHGLMIGQFHPVCEEPGLWNPAFRPLRAPVPLLAIRKLLPFDLPFLLDDAHLDAYLARFAPGLPARVRSQLASRLAGT